MEPPWKASCRQFPLCRPRKSEGRDKVLVYTQSILAEQSTPASFALSDLVAMVPGKKDWPSFQPTGGLPGVDIFQAYLGWFIHFCFFCGSGWSEASFYRYSVSKRAGIKGSIKGTPLFLVEGFHLANSIWLVISGCSNINPRSSIDFGSFRSDWGTPWFMDPLPIQCNESRIVAAYQSRHGALCGARPKGHGPTLAITKNLCFVSYHCIMPFVLWFDTLKYW